MYSTEGHTEGAVMELSALDAGSTTQGNVFFLKLSKAEFYAELLYFEHFLENLSVVMINKMNCQAHDECWVGVLNI